MKYSITISGSFQRAITEIRKDIKSFEYLECVILSPRMFKSYRNDDGFVILDSDGNRRPAAIHNRHLVSISQSSFLWVRNPAGYIGTSTAMEIGYSHAMGIPVFSSNKSSDASLNRYMVVAGSPNKAIALFEQRNVPVPSQPASTYDPQSEVAYMAATCGFDKESDEEILSFLDEEIIELKEAVSKNAIDPLEPHGIQEELADCAIYLYHFANQSGINLSDAMKRKVARNIIRWGRRKKVG